MGKYEVLAKRIVKEVGGAENINALTHCITRLRFKLKDESKANDQAFENMDGVVRLIKSGGQYQVVIGNHVGNVYADVVRFAGLDGDSTDTQTETKGIFNKLIDIISGCFQPIIAPLCAVGMIKGLNSLLLFFELYTNTSGTYIILNAIGDSLFYFMPIIIGYSASKKFGLHPIVGMIIGATLCYPAIQANTLKAGEPIGQLFTGSMFQNDYFLDFVGIPFMANNYTSSVVPVIVVVALASKVQNLGKRFIPEIIQNFFVPFFTLLVSLPIGLLVIGPIIVLLTNALGDAFMNLLAFSPIIYGAVIGFVWQVLVIFGLHWALIPLALIQLGDTGVTTIIVSMFAASFAQTAVVAAMYFKLKDKKLKDLCIPAVISGICGITEPAIYGITLPKKKPFIYSMIAASIGGVIIAVMNVEAYNMGGMGIFGVVRFINPTTGSPWYMYVVLLAIAVSMIIGFVLTFFFWKDDTVVAQEPETKSVKNEKVISPIAGSVLQLNEISDPAFESLGNGVVIMPEEGKVYAPFDGTIATLFPTKHAIGIVSDNGMELLIHVGIDTVELDGKHFEAFVKQGDAVKQGDLLLEFDMKAIEEAGYTLVSPIVITNTNAYKNINLVKADKVAKQELLFDALV
ncbi:PTS system beta-glucoside-specific IIA component (Glc family) /PTS system beta-glucoside-specific IIB component (Glc family) /PTS system beta-glucoside-specific IIC component (Glc family) [Breznakia blatticola]|uniref:PTS system beta-glucoside-specific IIA component (Glc family) /PTS system beta-glucoside-specific IIB component (Glc family) /PTS system beta-glucoside-specific IIC component (Glc family) n=1 Tax=Breznakia blatticola TaxID=1754012 RepID=A0A4R7ZNS6_9FIRM|nr:beta-glucoside-specific PTS transporter subunit IIABC [Breznakia blatticola]TDW16950.1 PTS system beta-glucoside-specific IIA component (Glc family) /PTS system beta-glucoside-specific IIB component (Glc family) /PTS system beta-glucoside-specific IIC component (Glc family) [Breznakia blatticola]